MKRSLALMLTLLGASAFAGGLPKAARELDKTIRARDLTKRDVEKLFSFPVAYEGFDLEKNGPDCNPPMEKRTIKDAGALVSLLAHARIEMGKAPLVEKDASTFLAADEGGDCGHYVQFGLDKSKKRFGSLKLWVSKIE